MGKQYKFYIVISNNDQCITFNVLNYDCFHKLIYEKRKPVHGHSLNQGNRYQIIRD